MGSKKIFFKSRFCIRNDFQETLYGYLRVTPWCKTSVRGMTSTASTILGGHYLQESRDSPAQPSSSSLSSSSSASTSVSKQQHAGAPKQQHNTGISWNSRSSRSSRSGSSSGNAHKRAQQGKYVGARGQSSPARGRELGRKCENHGGKRLPSSSSNPTSRKRTPAPAASPATPPDAFQSHAAAGGTIAAAEADRDMSASALLSSSRPSVHETFSYAETYPLARLPFASLQPHPSAARTFEEAQPPSAAELTGFQGSSTFLL